MITSLIVLISLFLFSSCTNTAEEAIEEQKSRVTVDFSTFQVEVEDMSRGSDDPLTLSDVAKRLSFAVFEKDGSTLVNGTTIHQVKSDDVNGFGKIQLELTSGSYQIVAVAHNGSGNVNIQSVESATLPGKTFTDTFVGVYDLNVTTADCSFKMSLNRITSAFYLNLTDDTPPKNARMMEIILHNGGSAPNQLNINPSTGYAEDNWLQSRTFTMTNIIDDELDLVYYIGKSSPTAVIVKATAKDLNSNEIMHRIFTNVPLTPNKKTRATGAFFNSSGSASFTITSDWASEDDEITYQ